MACLQLVAKNLGPSVTLEPSSGAAGPSVLKYAHHECKLLAIGQERPAEPVCAQLGKAAITGNRHKSQRNVELGTPLPDSFFDESPVWDRL